MDKPDMELYLFVRRYNKMSTGKVGSRGTNRRLPFARKLDFKSL